jgi:class 3 adenylate cyclase/Tfp pilus assembly protein PilF
MAEKVTATILFADIMDSMEIANYWEARKYDDFLNEFQDAMLRGLSMHRRGVKKINLAGDELVVFYCSKDVSEDVVNAIQLANTLKMLWCISESNRKRTREGKKIFDLGIGINTGDVSYGYRPTLSELKRLIGRRKTFEGLAISLAKRIEGFSRDGICSRIMIGHRTMEELNELSHGYECELRGLQRLKGIAQEIPIYELKSCYSYDAEILAEFKDLAFAIRQLERVKAFDPTNTWLLMTLIDIYSNKRNWKKVGRTCREALAIDDSVSNIHAELGQALTEQEDYDEALSHFDAAISLRPEFWGAYVGKSSCQVFLGQYDECIKTCRNAMRNMSRGLRMHYGDSLYYNIAAAYARKGDKRSALVNLGKAVAHGNRDVLAELRKDKDRDFVVLYDDEEFKRLRQGKTQHRMMRKGAARGRGKK